MDYKHQYESMKKMVAMYQDEIVPGLWEKIKELEKQMPKWIPVAERLPDKDGYYLVFKRNRYGVWRYVAGFAKDGRKVDRYDFKRQWENVWYEYDNEYGYVVLDSITHWMPLPEAPKEKENEG